METNLIVAVEELIEYVLGDDRSEATWSEVVELSSELKLHESVVIKEMKRQGLMVAEREIGRHMRGFRTSSNDRWFGPGSLESHGGSGAESMNGFAGHPHKPCIDGWNYNEKKSQFDSTNTKFMGVRSAR